MNPVDGGEHVLAPATRGQFRMAAISGHQRVYERATAAAEDAGSAVA